MGDTTFTRLAPPLTFSLESQIDNKLGMQVDFNKLNEFVISKGQTKIIKNQRHTRKEVKELIDPIMIDFIKDKLQQKFSSMKLNILQKSL